MFAMLSQDVCQRDSRQKNNLSLLKCLRVSEVHWICIQSTQYGRKKLCLEKEGLAIVSGIKRFNLYLYGRKFTLFIDHHPLTRTFGPKSGFPPLAAARLQSWAVLLSRYDYQIVNKRFEDSANADFFSKFPVQTRDEEDPDPDMCLLQLSVVYP